MFNFKRDRFFLSLFLHIKALSSNNITGDKMSDKKRKIVLFSIGGGLYGIIEILWRGHTHWSMFSAGGICFVIFSEIQKKFKNLSLFTKAFLGCGIITGIEFIFGIIFNVILKKNVWNYSKMPLNIGGQICALYSFFWLILSLIGIPLAGLCNNRLQKRNKMV